MTGDADHDLQRIRDKARAAKKAVAAISGTGVSANGDVTATVDANGRLRDLQLRAGALRLGPQLAAHILQATAAAEQDAAHKVHNAVRPLTHDPVLVSAKKTVNEFFGDDTPNSPPTRRAMSEQEMDEFYTNYDPLRGLR